MNHLCIYSKPPIPGQTKSRLAKTIGEKQAAELAKAQLIDICEALLEIENTHITLWHPPQSNPNQFRNFIPETIAYSEQSGTNLGMRMCNTFRRKLDGNNKVVIVGSDCISHCPASIEAAYRGLNHAPIVLQPATDGGYVLLGLSQFIPELFEEIDWGTSKVFEQTVSTIKRLGHRHALLPETFDVDEEVDIKKLCSFVSEHSRPHTKKWLEKYYT